MDIEFSQFQNQQVRLYDQFLAIGSSRLQFDETLTMGDSFSTIPVRSLVQTLEQYTGISHGECHPQLAILIFTLSGSPRALDFYFPLTRMFSGREIDQFYQFVDSVIQHPNFDLQLVGENHTDITAQTPLGIRYIIAGHIAEVFFHRRDISERFFASPRHFQLYGTTRAFKQDEGEAGGDYNPQRESIQLVMARLFEGFFGPTAGVCPFLHELAEWAFLKGCSQA